MSAGHAFLAPSSAGLTVNCHAAPLLQSKYPDVDTEASIEGNAAHWVLAQRIASNVPVAVGTLTPQGVPVSQEMIEGSTMMIEALYERFGDTWRGVNVETPLHKSNLHPMKNTPGTPDVWHWDANARVLDLYDYKFGHRPIDAYECWQCIDYVDKILLHVRQVDLAGVVVNITIVQPRAYHAESPVRSWSVHASDLVPYWNRLRETYYAACEPEPLATPGVWCKQYECKARAGCLALQRSAYFSASEAQRGVLQNLGPLELGTELVILREAKAVLDARIDGLEEQAIALMGAGTNVPHWTLARTNARRVWTKPPEEVIALGQMMGIALEKPATPITPAQATKAGLPAELLEQYSEKPAGALVLKPEATLNAPRVFKKEQ